MLNYLKEINCINISVFISLIRCGLGVRSDTLTEDQIDFELIERISIKQSLVPIIIAGLKKYEFFSSISESMKKCDSKEVFNYINRYDAINKLSKAFDDNNIDYILLKGSVINKFYPEPYMRTCSDIDILVKEESIENAISVVEKYTDFKRDASAEKIIGKLYHDISFINNRVHLELHFSIKENIEKMDRILESAWSFSCYSGIGNMYLFTTEFQVFHIIAHMANHFIRGGLGIRPFIDLWLMRKNTVYNEQQVLLLCKKCGLLKFYNECCSLVNYWFDNQEPSKTTKMLEKSCFIGGVYGSELFRIASEQRTHSGIFYILSRIFPPKYELLEYYSGDSSSRHSLLYYNFIRWKSWLSRDRRKRLRNEFSSILKSNKEDIDFANDLFKRLDL